eukprot:792304-Pelagomonas_calceolata.AAC.1
MAHNSVQIFVRTLACTACIMAHNPVQISLHTPAEREAGKQGGMQRDVVRARPCTHPPPYTPTSTPPHETGGDADYACMHPSPTPADCCPPWHTSFNMHADHALAFKSRCHTGGVPIVALQGTNPLLLDPMSHFWGPNQQQAQRTLIQDLIPVTH